VAEGFDLGLRIADMKDSSLIAKPLGTYRMICAASPEYLAKHPIIETPKDLETHPCLTYSLIAQPTNWTLTRGDEATSIKVRSALQLNNGDSLAKAACQHLGVLYQPDFILNPHLESGLLTPILTEWQGRALHAWLVYPARKYLPMKVQAMLEFLKSRFPG